MSWGDGGREIGTVRSPVAFLKEGEPTSLQCMGAVQAGMGPWWVRIRKMHSALALRTTGNQSPKCVGFYF